MFKTKDTVKYEVVIGVPDGMDNIVVNGLIRSQDELMMEAWKKYAKEFYDKTDIYVSAIAIKGKALYHNDWGCPYGGENTITFNCTPNRAFIEDLFRYEKGIYYITGKLKKEFNQHTITITKMEAAMAYFTDEDNKELEEFCENI